MKQTENYAEILFDSSYKINILTTTYSLPNLPVLLFDELMVVFTVQNEAIW